MKNHTPKYYAFFDVDGTLIKGQSMLSFLKFYYLNHYHSMNFVGYLKYKLFILKHKVYSMMGANREYLNKDYYRNFKGEHLIKIKILGEKWFFQEIQSQNLYIKKIMNELLKHKNYGAQIVLVSGSFPACLEPFAKQFGIRHILSTTLETKNEKLTGNILHPQTIGKGKVEVIQDFILKNNFCNLSQCYAYGDHSSDIPMLSLVGYPKVVKGDLKMESYAKKKGWELI